MKYLNKKHHSNHDLGYLLIAEAFYKLILDESTTLANLQFSKIEFHPEWNGNFPRGMNDHSYFAEIFQYTEFNQSGFNYPLPLPPLPVLPSPLNPRLSLAEFNIHIFFFSYCQFSLPLSF